MAPSSAFAGRRTEIELLGTMLLSSTLFAAAVSSGLEVSHFCDDQVKDLARISFEQFQRYGEANRVTLSNEAMDRGYFKIEGHPVWDLDTVEPNELSFSDSLRRVMTSAKLRHFSGLLREVQDEVYGVHGLSLMQREQRMYDGISMILSEVQEQESTFYSADQVADIVRQNYEAAQSGTRTQLSPTGIYSLDEKIGGLDNRVVMVCARPSHGKTAFAMWLTETHCKLWKERGESGQVLYFSAEMGIDIMTDRILSQLSGVNARIITSGSVDGFDRPKVESALDRIGSEIKVCVDTHSSPTTAYMMGRALAQNAAERVRLIIFDYLEYTGEKGQSEDLRLGKALKGCHEIAKRIGCPVVVVSQLNRNIEKRGNDARPQLADIRYTGAAEQIASLVIMLYHPWIHWHQRGQQGHEDEEPDPFHYELLIRKNTNGPIGDLRLEFDRATTSFQDPGLRAKSEGRLIAKNLF